MISNCTASKATEKNAIQLKGNSKFSLSSNEFFRKIAVINHFIAWFVFPQLNQQNQSTKGAQAQDYSFLNEASPIYVTSLTGNHVTGTTTLTTSNLSSSNSQQTSTTFAPPVNTVSGSVASDSNQSRTIQSIAHVHQPPASIHNKQQQTQTKVVNQQPLAGGWLIGESAKGTLITNDQQAFQNILNNNTSSNNISVRSSGGTVVYSGNCISSTSETATNTALHASSLSGAASALASGDSIKYGNTSKTATSSELLANGHGPRREVSPTLYTHYNYINKQTQTPTMFAYPHAYWLHVLAFNSWDFMI